MQAETEPTKAQPETENWLGPLGMVLLLMGLAPLAYIGFTSPELISLNAANPSTLAIIDGYGAGAEAMFVAWAFFLCPISMICGAVFMGAAGIINAINHKRLDG